MPQALKNIHKKILLLIDLFFVNGVPFLHSTSQKIGLRPAEVLSDRHADSMLKHLHSAIDVHVNHGFTISSIDTDLEFSSIETRVLIDEVTAPFNIIDVDDKNHPAEHSISVTKELVHFIM